MGNAIFYIIIIASFMFLLLTFFVVYLTVFQNKRKLIFKQELLRTQIEIQEQTLKTISEEIHDNVGQVLSLAKFNLNTLDLTEGNRTKLTNTKNLIGKAINDLRDLSRSLHNERIGEIGLRDAVENELKIIENTGQFKTALAVTGSTFKLNGQKEMLLFRIVQEALHNAMKHAGCSSLTVQINYSPVSFGLTISDNGKGFTPGQLTGTQNGIGLKSMKNRAALIGGKFSILSPPQGGTSIIIDIPTENLKR